ncbi:hypothetical protein FSARC_9771 [Fusarium sarcochroum]|uniref:Uncharacterized protein n=1 Tax=Fusarium sarcochroum TaxID=1208366 RepID=A0A8H4TQA1_9HYPO|nr:hypothetical protein FSARC_9771 [Fusarium sarcochroum]
MHRSAALLALGALTSPATAGWFKSNEEPSWSPPQQTGIYGEEAGERADIAMGWSPKPTGAPEVAGAMDLKFALGKRALKPNTCGYGEVGNSFTCVTTSDICSYSDSYIGCCETGRSCNIVKTTCVDYASAASICKFVDDFHTMCCDSALPSCFSWIGTTSGDEYTILSCGATGGTSLLLFSDPLAETSSIDSSTTDASSTTTDDNSSSTTSEPAASSTEADHDDGPNVGAIAGGTVGGVAALALVGLAAFLLFRRRKKTTPAATPLAADSTQGAPPMAQHPQSPGNSFVPSSPSNATYPSGVPQNFQGYQQAYDPNLAAPYGQPQGYQQPGYGGYSPQPQNLQGQYPQQGYGQQSQYPSQYGVGGYAAPSSTSPPPGHFTPSPGPKDGGEAPLGGHQQHHHQAQELPAVNPVGNEGNRAELS